MFNFKEEQTRNKAKSHSFNDKWAFIQVCCGFWLKDQRPKSLIRSKSGIKTPSFSWMKKTKICLSLLIKVCSISICFDYKAAQLCKDANLCPLGNRFLEIHFHPKNSKYKKIFILFRFSLLLVFSLPIIHLFCQAFL